MKDEVVLMDSDNLDFVMEYINWLEKHMYVYTFEKKKLRSKVKYLVMVWRKCERRT